MTLCARGWASPDGGSKAMLDDCRNQQFESCAHQQWAHLRPRSLDGAKVQEWIGAEQAGILGHEQVPGLALTAVATTAEGHQPRREAARGDIHPEQVGLRRPLRHHDIVPLAGAEAEDRPRRER